MKVPVLFFICLYVLSPFVNAQTPKYTVANGEYANYILDNTTQTLYGVGLGAIGAGTNPGIPGLPIPCQFPSANTKIAFVAGGLHTGTCIDVNGNVYFTGPNEDGTMGNGTTTGSAGSFVQITTDSLGNPFTNVTYLRMSSAIFTGGQGYGAICYAIKSDGSLWVWGNTQGGYRGNGTYGTVNTRPVQVPFPAGTVITKVIIQNIAMALDASGNVWTWAGNNTPALLGNSSQTDYETPHMISLPSPAIDIAGGGFFSYALLSNHSLYGWGWYTGYMGVGNSPGSGVVGLAPPNKPMLLDTSLNLPSPIAKLSTNGTSTYVILQDSTLWAWGGNECGQIGEGTELNWKVYTVNPAPYGGSTPEPYNWNQDASTAQLQQHKPIQIAPGLHSFVGLSEGTAAVFYKFAVDASGQLYSWGRNKNGVLANGVIEADVIDGTLGANYPNSFDVPYITAINPFTATKNILSSSPICISIPGAQYCSVYSIPINTPPSAMINGTKNGTETVSGVTSVALDGTASTDNVAIVYYVWTQVSGPNTPIISIPSGQKVNILNVVQGTYVFQLKTIDNGWLSDSTTYTVVVGPAGPQPPVANAGSSQTITLPTNMVTLVGSGSEVNGTIVSYAWTQVSGPSTAAMGSATLAQTTVSGLIQGVYRFQLTVTDQAGVTASATVQVTVNAAIVPGLPLANAGSNQSITLPTNSVTLIGSGSELNGTIVSFDWTQVSGPSTATMGSAGLAQTTASGLIPGVYRFQLTITDLLGITATATVQVTVNAAIAPGPPVANAGSNQTITLPTNSVTLSGSGSETNGTIASYAWTQLSGPSTAAIGSADQASTTVGSLLQGVYRFQLTVTDNSGVTATATVQVTVNAAVVPGSPVANAGTDQTITLPTNSVTLTGSGSETNGTIVSYAWTQVSGPSTATIVTAAQASTTVNSLAQGVYTFQLTVTDNSGVTATDVVKVTVNPAVVVPGAPVVNAGSDQTITLPTNSVTLTATASESGGTIVSYAWVQVSGPTTAAITTANQVSTSVTGLTQGVYSFQITVTDNSGVTATDVVKVTVNAAAPVAGPPSANAGSDQTITLPVSSTTLTGSGSETNGTIVSYAWTQVSGPSTAAIGTSGQASTTVSSLVQGVYTFQLTVKDNSGVTATDVVKVTVNAAAPVAGPPSANAGPDQTITLPTNSVTLSGSGSETNGTIVSYTWTQVTGPSTAAIAADILASTTVSSLVQGVYTFQLTVKDNSGVTATDVVKVTVNAAAPVAGPPSANAGSDQTITLPTNSVTLTGSGSEANGTIVSYQWVQASGPSTAGIADASQASTLVSALVQGVYTFKLTVKDNSGVTATDVVTVTVKAAAPVAGPPIANAGPDQVLTLPVNSTTLAGSGSETNGTIVSYAWTQVSGPSTATIASDAQASTTVSALVQGVYTFKLTVKDNSGVTATDDVTVTVNAAGVHTPPVAVAGQDQVLTMPVATATLNGTASYDADGTIVSYQWVQISGGGGITIVSSSTGTALVYGLQPGVYVFQLTVTDNLGATSSAQVTITVSAGNGTGPVAVPGNDTTIAYPADSVPLNGSGSYDPGGTIVAYSWTQVSGPAAADLSGASSPLVVTSGLVVGQYVFSLTVTDNNGDTASATVKVIVADNLRTSGNTMGIYPNPFLGSSVTLNGMNSWTGPVRVSLYDLNGRQVITYVFAKQGPEFQQQLNLPAGLAAGVYILNVQFSGEKKPYSYKLVKQ